ncbi:MAG: hypothetical protein H7319_00395 [Spirosoma sp.]|nr:hypothetical protein [Spirosoma sp.]
MTLKLGNTILNQRASRDLFLMLFSIGVYIGISFALTEDGKGPVSLPLAIPVFLIVAKLIRAVRQEVINERNIENDEKL